MCGIETDAESTSYRGEYLQRNSMGRIFLHGFKLIVVDITKLTKLRGLAKTNSSTWILNILIMKEESFPIKLIYRDLLTFIFSQLGCNGVW